MITNGNISNPSPGREIKDKSVKKKKTQKSGNKQN
jgi:hypothetical protein